MKRFDITMAQGASVSAILDAASALAGLDQEKDFTSGAMVQLIIPTGFTGTYIDVELLDDATDSNGQGGPLLDLDGTTKLSRITTPGSLPARIALNPQVFCYTKGIRLRTDGVAPLGGWAFGAVLRKAR